MGAKLDRTLLWSPMNLRRDGLPTKIVGKGRVECSGLDATFDLVMRLNPDKPWEHTSILLHVTSGKNVRRLDLRGSHVDRSTGEQWINRTHKHRWSEADGNKSVYMPDDIRHVADVPLISSMKDLADEYREVFEDFTKECLIDLGPAYIWSDPSYPEVQDTLPTLERYP
ncbi:MAG: hypothetical protein M3443_09030 [Actinomycetota bacterium]|nr:hypothetical protein [Actinomycetota bacterium]